jgi:hypothetical protein
MIKKIIILQILISACFTLYAQNNFTHIKEVLTWETVYNNNVSISDLNLYLKTQGFNCTISGTLIEFDKGYGIENLKPYGYTFGGFPTYMNDGFYKGYIEFKEGRYRVTIPSIKIINTLDTSLNFELETWIYRKDKMRMPEASLKVLTTFDAYFTELFTYKELKNDW